MRMTFEPYASPPDEALMYWRAAAGGPGPVAAPRVAAPAVVTAAFGAVLHLSACQVDLDRRTVVRGSTVISLTPIETRLLSYLSSRRDALVTTEELLKVVWGEGQADSTIAVVHAAMFALRDKVERDPGRPEHLTDVPGSGYRFVPSHPMRLGRKRWVGRKQELKRLDRLFRDSQRLVTIVGPAGVGKTELSKVFLDRKKQDAVTIDMRPVGVSQDVMTAVAGRLGVAPNTAAVQRWGESRPHVALVIDNAEHVLDGVRALIEACDANWLVTSRVPLKLANEKVLHLGPLAVDQSVELMRLHSPLFDDEATWIHRLVDGVGQLPLAIELVASRLGTLSCRDLVDRLADSHDVVAHRGRSDRPPHLTAAIELSWALLDLEQRMTLVACSVFEGDFSEEDLGRVRGWELAGAVADLVGVSLVAIAPGGVHGRSFRMLRAVREFVIEQETFNLARMAARRSHLAWLVDGTQRALSQHTVDAGFLRHRVDELRGGARFAEERGDFSAALWLRAGLAQLPGGGQSVLDSLETALCRVAQDPSEAGVGAALYSRGVALYRLGAVRGAREQWLQLFRSSCSASVQAMCAFALASMFADRRDAASAATWIGEFRRTGGDAAGAEFLTGRLNLVNGDTPGAEACFARGAGSREPSVLNTQMHLRLAMIKWYAGDTTAALTLFERVRADSEARSDRSSLGVVHYRIGATLALEGRFDEALLHLKTSRRLIGEDPTLRGDVGLYRGYVLALRGSFDEAVSEWSDAMNWLSSGSVDQRMALVWTVSALCALQRGPEARAMSRILFTAKWADGPFFDQLERVVTDMLKWLEGRPNMDLLKSHLLDLRENRIGDPRTVSRTAVTRRALEVMTDDRLEGARSPLVNRP